MENNMMIFDKTPHPTSIEEHHTIQDSLMKREEEEHQLIEIYKGIEVMERYKKDNEFLLSALQERIEDYRVTLGSLEESILQLGEDEESKKRDENLEE
jgi:hypothetical protein